MAKLTDHIKEATLQDAIEWNQDPMGKFIFCADVLGLSVIDNERIIDRWVDKLEAKYEKLLKNEGIKISD